MGQSMSGLLRSLTGRKKEIRLLMLGLDAAGKTTIMYKLQLGEVVTTIPTIGFNVETAELRSSKGPAVFVTCWDVGGRSPIRPLWRHYYQNTSGLVYVVDSNDRDRLEQAHDELRRLLSEDELYGLPLLVLANKQDLPNSMTVAEIEEGLGLQKTKDRKYLIQGCVANSGKGLLEAFDWLLRAANGDQGGLEERYEAAQKLKPRSHLLSWMYL